MPKQEYDPEENIKNEIWDIYQDLKVLEDFYNKEYITLKTYYDIKNNMLIKLSGVTDVERESIKTKMELL